MPKSMLSEVALNKSENKICQRLIAHYLHISNLAGFFVLYF